MKHLTDTDVRERFQSVSANPLYKVRELTIYLENREVPNIKRQKEQKLLPCFSSTKFPCWPRPLHRIGGSHGLMKLGKGQFP